MTPQKFKNLRVGTLIEHRFSGDVWRLKIVANSHLSHEVEVLAGPGHTGIRWDIARRASRIEAARYDLVDLGNYTERGYKRINGETVADYFA